MFLPHSSAETFELLDANQKSYLQVKRRGTISHDAQLIERFARAYVAFSGLSFPDLLVPLMEKHSVMINPERPMVVYDSMEFDLAHTTLVEPQLELSHHQLEVNGKRGLVTLEFTISDQNQPIGKGCKRMTLGGLRDYNP
ncbi:MAG: DUF3581 family protein, partial [Bacteroidia bacterium]|nr:DUF3581 family protein [Bacteroidia bacterium]